MHLKDIIRLKILVKLLKYNLKSIEIFILNRLVVRLMIDSTIIDEISKFIDIF